MTISVNAAPARLVAGVRRGVELPFLIVKDGKRFDGALYWSFDEPELGAPEAMVEAKIRQALCSVRDTGELGEEVHRALTMELARELATWFAFTKPAITARNLRRARALKGWETRRARKP